MLMKGGETFSLDLSLQFRLIDRDEHFHGNCFESDRCRSHISSFVAEFSRKNLRRNRRFSEEIRRKMPRRARLSNRPIINHHTRNPLKDKRSISLFVRLLSKKKQRREEKRKRERDDLSSTLIIPLLFRVARRRRKRRVNQGVFVRF